MNANVIKTVNYIKRNGMKKAVGAIYERLTAHYDEEYFFSEITPEQVQQQREAVKTWRYKPLVSILVPAYETDETFLKELLDSVWNQTYENWQLVIADASSTDRVQNVVTAYTEELERMGVGTAQCQRILYGRLAHNDGISDNTNQALEYAEGDYVALLDHDDLLTQDALYEMVSRLQEHKYVMLYSDEDKCDETSVRFYEPNIKPEFNFDYLLSNNYICHLLLMQTQVMEQLRFRSAFDGAQDYDLILRGATVAMGAELMGEKPVCHVPKVLYHWRCHSASTAANPASKYYAYEAGRRALEAYVREQGLPVKGVEHTDHLGFYRLCYDESRISEAIKHIEPTAAAAAFAVRLDLLAIGGSVYGKDNKITSGILDNKGNCPAEGLRKTDAGKGNWASVPRDVYALDARAIVLRDASDEALYEEIIGLSYRPLSERDAAFCNSLDEHIWRQRSISLCQALIEKYNNNSILMNPKWRFLWDPQIRVSQK